MPVYMPNAFVIFFLIALLTLAYFYFKRTLLNVPIGKKKIPVVPGGLPIIGHAIPLTFNALGFLKECYEKHGPIFEIKLLMTNIVIICNHGLARLYFATRKDNLHMEMSSLNMDWTVHVGRILAEDVKGVMNLAHISHDKNLTCSKIGREGEKIVDEMKSKIGNGKLTCKLSEEMNKFILRTVFTGFIPMENTEELLNDLHALVKISSKLMMLGIVVPVWFCKLCFEWRIRQLRRKLMPHFVNEIQKYRDDEEKCDSSLIRQAVDFGKDKRRTSDEEIVEIIVSSIFGAIVSTPGAVANVILLLSLPENRSTLNELRDECTKCLGDIVKILEVPLLSACVTESNRLTSQILLSPRTPVSKTSFIGDYHIGNHVHFTFLSPQMLHVHGDSSKLFHEPTNFKPQRFLGIDPEPQTAPASVTWGGGSQLCPGRSMALSIIKIAVAQLIHNFDFKVENDRLDFDYNTFSAFGQVSAATCITQRELK